MKATVASDKTFTPADLATGLHPAILVGVSQEAIPDGWEMGKKHTHMWRWHFLGWTNKKSYEAGDEPEELTPISSPVITPANKFQASKAYTYLSELLGRELAAGEGFDFDTMLPMHCQVMVWQGIRNERQTCVLEHILPAEAWQAKAKPPERLLALRAEIKEINEVFEAFGQVTSWAKQAAQGASPPARTDVPGDGQDDIPF